MEKLKRGVAMIPNKLYFRIGEVSDIIGVKPYVLRYWESEFPDIKPSKSKSGQRLYKRRDVEMLSRIKELLYDERFTINGARKRLKDMGKVCFEGKDLSPAGIEESVPKQLEVFEKQAEHKTMSQKESSKVLIKIRRDLESLLEVVRG